jgi:LAO/AO transport system kinase
VSGAMPITQVAQAICAGDVRALARGLTLAERGGPPALALRTAVAQLSRQRAHVIGITGAPGAGKSTLTTAMAQCLRQHGLRLGIIAIDPASPYSGGALLGDRIRMYDLAGDAGIFIRSMANRGRIGGVAAATMDAVLLMGAAHYDLVLVETVGAGQSDVTVSDVADTVLLVESPGMGDEVQSIKAGLLEVADVIAVNKCDRADAPATLQQLKALVRMTMPSADVWPVPVHGVSGLLGSGVDELVAALLAHRTWIAAHPQSQRQQLRRVGALQRAVEVRLMERVVAHPAWAHLRAELLQQPTDALSIDRLAESLIARVFADRPLPE